MATEHPREADRCRLIVSCTVQVYVGRYVGLAIRDGWKPIKEEQFDALS